MQTLAFPKPVNVVGVGYIGLPTALMLAARGLDVVGSDIDVEKVNKLNAGSVTFEEHGLQELFAEAKGRVRFAAETIATDLYIVAVPTPFDGVTKKINAEFVLNAVEGILSVCDERAVVCIESTISPGTVDRILRPSVAKSGKQIGLAHAPERVVPGNMIHELVHNSRTLGTDDAETAQRLSALYRLFCQGEIVVTDIKTAELSKVVENTYRDINIAFANELSRICHRENVDVRQLIEIANRHPRVGILSPGPGVGGHCIAVDPWFLVGDHPDLAGVVRAARETNDSQPKYVVGRLLEILEERGMDVSRVGLYGLTYKPDVDDTRGSPGLQILELMREKGQVCSFDPHVAPGLANGQAESIRDFLQSVDLVVVLMAHSQIKGNRGLLEGKIVFDTCNALGGAADYNL